MAATSKSKSSGVPFKIVPGHHGGIISSMGACRCSFTAYTALADTMSCLPFQSWTRSASFSSRHRAIAAGLALASRRVSSCTTRSRRRWLGDDRQREKTPHDRPQCIDDIHDFFPDQTAALRRALILELTKRTRDQMGECPQRSYASARRCEAGAHAWGCMRSRSIKPS